MLSQIEECLCSGALSRFGSNLHPRQRRSTKLVGIAAHDFQIGIEKIRCYPLNAGNFEFDFATCQHLAMIAPTPIRHMVILLAPVAQS